MIVHPLSFHCKKIAVNRFPFRRYRQSARRNRPIPVGHGQVLVRPVSLKKRTLDALPKTVVLNYLSDSANCARTLRLAVSAAALL